MDAMGDFRLAEGPRYDVRTRTLYLVDINGRRLHVRPDSGTETSFEFAEHVTSVNLCTDERQVLVSSGSSLWLVDVPGGRRSLLLEMDLGAGMRFNDAALSPSGNLLIGSMRIDRPRVDEGCVYLVSPGLVVKELATGFAVPNGLFRGSIRPLLPVGVALLRVPDGPSGHEKGACLADSCRENAAQ